MVVQAQGRFAEAEVLYLQALQIARATIGNGHPAYATHLNNLARLLVQQERAEEARPLLTQALSILQATLPAAHPHVASAQAQIAGLPKP